MYRRRERIGLFLVIAGYGYVTVQLSDSFLSIPVVYPALLISIFAESAASLLPKLSDAVYWLLFSLFVFQLVTIHENNICLRDTCVTTDLQKYIALGGTGLAVALHKSGTTKKPQKVQQKEDIRKVLPNQPIKLKFERNDTNVKWV